MKLIDNILKKFGVDKILHFLVGALTTAIGAMIDEVAMFVFAVLLFIVSVAKEGIDNTFDFKDVIFSLYGGVTIIGLYYLIHIFI